MHRLLALAVGADISYPELLDKKKSQALCFNLNYRHRMAQYAGRASVSLHTQVSRRVGLYVRVNCVILLWLEVSSLRSIYGGVILYASISSSGGGNRDWCVKEMAHMEWELNIKYLSTCEQLIKHSNCTRISMYPLYAQVQMTTLL